MRNPSASESALASKPYPHGLYHLLKEQGYHWVGRHSAVKKCRWLHESLVHDRPCYKEKFYGIKSHRCLQLSPAVLSCLTHCVYCWRVLPEDLGYGWEEFLHGSWDEPEELVEELIKEQRRILSGYKAQVLAGRVDEEKYEEALRPNQAAISLSGEPTLYPKLPEMIRIFKEKGFTVYLVTSGVLPSVLERLVGYAEPTQLYISLTAPDPKTYSLINRPISEGIWYNVLKSIEKVKDFSCRKVLRITLIKGVNMSEDMVQGFSKLIARSSFDFIEAKAYVHVGYSTRRLKRESMPSFTDVKKFAEELADATSYRIKDGDLPSRVILLTKT